MSALSIASTIDHGPMGQYRKLTFVVTACSDTDTLTLPSTLNIVDHSIAWTGDPGTQTSAGGHYEYASNVFTMHPSTDALGCRVTVIVGN